MMRALSSAEAGSVEGCGALGVDEPDEDDCGGGNEGGEEEEEKAEAEWVEDDDGVNSPFAFDFWAAFLVAGDDRGDLGEVVGGSSGLVSGIGCGFVRIVS
jgi:hypothetical protein